jgi:hypothetical protein
MKVHYGMLNYFFKNIFCFHYFTDGILMEIYGLVPILTEKATTEKKHSRLSFCDVICPEKYKHLTKKQMGMHEL